MEPDFWHQRWQSNRIGFHESETNALLVKHIDQLQLKKNSRIFIPLCGKTLDISWFLSQGYRVAGIELNQQAVDQLFSELGLQPDIKRVGELLHYSNKRIDIFVGDIFNLGNEILGDVDAIYDRAALVALPPKMRMQYSGHLAAITNNARQFLICFEYDQLEMQGPPFSINAIEVKIQYTHIYDIKLIETIDVPDGLRKQLSAKESVWLLTEKTG